MQQNRGPRRGIVKTAANSVWIRLGPRTATKRQRNATAQVCAGQSQPQPLACTGSVDGGCVACWAAAYDAELRLQVFLGRHGCSAAQSRELRQRCRITRRSGCARSCAVSSLVVVNSCKKSTMACEWNAQVERSQGCARGTLERGGALHCRRLTLNFADASWNATFRVASKSTSRRFSLISSPALIQEQQAKWLRRE